MTPAPSAAPSSSGQLVRIEDVRKTYVQGDLSVDILKGVSLAIGQGEFVALQGP